MSTLLQKVNSGPMSDVPLRQDEPILTSDTSVPVSCGIIFVIAIG